MTGDLVVDFGGLLRLQSRLRDTYQQIEQELAELSTSVDTLCKVWEGSAADGFQRTVASWRAHVADLQDGLAELHNMVGNAHDNHARAVHANMAIWRRR